MPLLAVPSLGGRRRASLHCATCAGDLSSIRALFDERLGLSIVRCARCGRCVTEPTVNPIRRLRRAHRVPVACGVLGLQILAAGLAALLLLVTASVLVAAWLAGRDRLSADSIVPSPLVEDAGTHWFVAVASASFAGVWAGATLRHVPIPRLVSGTVGGCLAIFVVGVGVDALHARVFGREELVGIVAVAAALAGLCVLAIPGYALGIAVRHGMAVRRRLRIRRMRAAVRALLAGGGAR